RQAMPPRSPRKVKSPANIAAAATVTAISESRAKARKAYRARMGVTTSARSAAIVASALKARAGIATSAATNPSARTGPTSAAAPPAATAKGPGPEGPRSRPLASPICDQPQPARQSRRRSELALRKARGAQGAARAQGIAFSSEVGTRSREEDAQASTTSAPD